jgi:anti-sigma28 factor (negative regulator of flagellin synthesis)
MFGFLIKFPAYQSDKSNKRRNVRMKIEKNRSVTYRRSSWKQNIQGISERKGNARLVDAVNLSSRIIQVSEVVGIIRRLPEIRKRLVKRLQGEIRSGEYHIPSEDVAEKILSDHWLERIR